MKNSTARPPHDVISHVSPKSRKILKSSSTERVEKEKVTNRLRQLVAAEEDADQYELVLATIAHIRQAKFENFIFSTLSYIRELQAQLSGKENSLPAGFEHFFTSSASVSPSTSRPDTSASSPESSPTSSV